MKDQLWVMNSHVKGGKTLCISRNDQGDQGVDFIADIPPFIGNEKWSNLFFAAPDLLEACKIAVTYASTQNPYPAKITTLLDRAIAKAEGNI